MGSFQTLCQEIEQIITKSPLPFDVSHSKKTLEWLIKLRPDADEALKIAALAHDIERAVTGITETYSLKDLTNLDQFKREHAKRSAEIITEILKKHHYDSELITRVHMLVEKHEEGGNTDVDSLMNADSLAFFDHFKSYYEKNGPDKARVKVRFMIQRMSPPAKKILSQMKFGDDELDRLIQGGFGS